MRSLDECIKFIKDMGNTYTAVGDIRTGEWYNDILHYLEMVPRITWVKVTDEVPSNMDNHYLTLFSKNMNTGECSSKVCTGWYEPWDKESGKWCTSDGFEYEWYADEPCMLAKDFSKVDPNIVSRVSAWSREVPEFGIEPYKEDNYE